MLSKLYVETASCCGILLSAHLDEVNFLSTGTVKWFNAAKGYGFIEPEGSGADVFVHISAIEQAGLGNLNEGDRVEYELAKGQNGKSSAENLKLVS